MSDLPSASAVNRITSNGRQNQRTERSLVNPIVRRALLSLFCGSASSVFLCSAVGNVSFGLCLGALLRIGQVFAFFDLESVSAIDGAMTCAAFSLPFWAAINLIFLPVAAGQVPHWAAGDMPAHEGADACRAARNPPRLGWRLA